MRTITLTVFLLCITFALAYPWDKDEGLYPSGRGRGRPISRRSSAQSPHWFYREPRYVQGPSYSYGPEDESEGYGPKYRIYKRQRDDDDEESDEEDDDIQDDVQDEEDAEEEQFDTPHWEQLFPREQTGSYGQAQSGGPGPSHSSGGNFASGPPPQQDSGSYELAQGSPGSPGYSSGTPVIRGRSGSGKRVRPVTVKIMKPRNYEWSQPQMTQRWQPHRRTQGPYQYQYVSQPMSTPSRRWTWAEQQPQYVQYQPVRGNWEKRGSKKWGRQQPYGPVVQKPQKWGYY